MSFLDALWHLIHLLAPALATGGLAAAGAKLLWRRELAAVPWYALAGAAAAGGVAVTLAGLMLTGRDGRMATYLGVVLACALMLWWRGFWRRR